MSQNLQNLLGNVEKFVKLDNPKDDNENLIDGIIQYYNLIKNSNIESERVKANDAILTIGMKFPKLNDWCLNIISDKKEEHTYSRDFIYFMALSEKVLGLEKLTKKEYKLIKGMIYFYNEIKKGTNQEEFQIVEKKILSIAKKFPMLNEFFTKIIADNKTNENSNVEKFKKMISITIEEFRKKSQGGFYSPEYCSEYVNQMEIYRNSLKSLRSYFSVEEYDSILKIINNEINAANYVLNYSDFIENEFGGRRM